ncbi:MAG: hypothetical protein LAP85_29055 [Acidobacteriia bacterium]|nr:hypothetical protein [Terriglobia bacterium]
MVCEISRFKGKDGCHMVRDKTGVIRPRCTQCNGRVCCGKVDSGPRLTDAEYRRMLDSIARYGARAFYESNYD